jgi:putative cardiolipin synthase
MRLYDEARQSEYGAALSHGIRKAIQSGRFDVEWVPAEVAADRPEKAGGPLAETELLAADMLPVLMSARKEVFVASAYFVPRERGVALLSALARRGVRVVVLTNSMDSNDVEPVHGHYSHYRKALLEAGVELWELRPDKDRPDRSLMGLGRSLSGLHSKAFLVDRRYLFVGSFNWDPRSVGINTEMGILVDAPAIGQSVIERLYRRLPHVAYRLRLDDEGDIYWVTRRPDGAWSAYLHEPSTSPWRKFRTSLYGLLPISGQM